MNKNMPISLLDSGIGGVTVLAELVKIMPNESYLYFGDIRNAPYGEKSSDEVRAITLKNIDSLIKMGTKAVVIACNTATGAAVKEAREIYAPLPIIGIEPAIKPATTLFRGQNVLIMATPLTLKQEKFNALYNDWKTTADTELLPCPRLANLIEAGHIDNEEIRQYLSDLFCNINKEGLNAIVLGCTHYPIIKDIIQDFFPSATLFDGGKGTAKQTKRLLEDLNLLSGSLAGEIKVTTSLGHSKTAEFTAKLTSLLWSLIK